MQIQPITFGDKLDPNIRYRRMLNRLNLQARENMETIDMFLPLDTPERTKAIKSLEEWKEAQKVILHERCFNPKPSILKRLMSLIVRK